MLGDGKVDEQGNVYDTKDCNVMYLDKEGEDREISVSFLFLHYIFPLQISVHLYFISSVYLINFFIIFLAILMSLFLFLFSKQANKM